MLPTDVQVYIATAATDMRKSFLGLSLLVQDVLEKKPTSGALFVFVNRRGNKLKILYWDRNGFALWYKQLAKGVFRLPCIQGQASCTVSLRDLNLLLAGIDLSKRQGSVEITQTLIN